MVAVHPAEVQMGWRWHDDVIFEDIESVMLHARNSLVGLADKWLLWMLFCFNGVEWWV